MVVTPDGALELATARARELFDCATTEELRSRWPTLATPLHSALLRADDIDVADVHLEVPIATGSRRLRVVLERVRDAGADRYAGIVREATSVHAVATDLRLATHLRALGRLSTAVAHDLKAPLAAVLLHLELLRGTLASETPEHDSSLRERRLRYVGIIKDELGRLSQSLASLFSHIALRGDTEEDLDVRELIHELDFLVRSQARMQGVVVDVVLGEGAVTVRGHRDALRHAVLNVALNALEAMPAGGRLHVDLTAKENFVTISIRDTGPAIPGEVLTKMYDLRYTTKASRPGLGLSVAKAVIEAQGGRIRTEQSAEGVCFYLDLATSRNG